VQYVANDKNSDEKSNYLRCSTNELLKSERKSIAK
jgi:hypothetical protein